MNVDIKYPELEFAIKTLKESGCDFAFFHEAALAIWRISYNSFISNIDVLLDKDIKTGSNQDYIIKQLSDNIALRLWPAGQILGEQLQQHDIWSETYKCRVLDPELVLELLPYSPDFQHLYEARARLALVLYHNKMTEAELLEFSKYVRGI